MGEKTKTVFIAHTVSQLQDVKLGSLISGPKLREQPMLRLDIVVADSTGKDSLT